MSFGAILTRGGNANEELDVSASAATQKISFLFEPEGEDEEEGRRLAAKRIEHNNNAKKRGERKLQQYFLCDYCYLMLRIAA